MPEIHIVRDYALADQVVLIDRGRVTAGGTPAQIKSRIGAQRVDVTATDDAGYRALHAALAAAFDLTTAEDRRTLSVPAPRAATDLAAVTAVVQRAGVPVEEVALRRPTLDDAFLALTGASTTEQP